MWKIVVECVDGCGYEGDDEEDEVSSYTEARNKAIKLVKKGFVSFVKKKEGIVVSELFDKIASVNIYKKKD